MEEYSRFVAVRPINEKRDSAKEVIKFVKVTEKQSGHTIRKVNKDGRKEFRRVLEKLEGDGVDISITAAYTPESNGLAERTNQTGFIECKCMS